MTVADLIAKRLPDLNAQRAAGRQDFVFWGEPGAPTPDLDALGKALARRGWELVRWHNMRNCGWAEVRKHHDL